jgi:hypothetical protein
MLWNDILNCVSLATFALLSNASVVEPYEPKTLQEAKESTHWNQWEKATKDEYDSLVENKTWGTNIYP